MLFNSLTFVLFFAAVLAVHSAPLTWKMKKTNLLVASYLFYAAWNPPFVVLVWISTVVDWFVARGIAHAERRAAKRSLLLLSLSCNLGLLGYFKYGAFLLESFTTVVRACGLPYQPAAPSIILPVGISFYTFQTLSYTIDVYRGSARPWHSFLDFALYVAFFPQLVAGPIVRSSQFLPQCIEPRRASARELSWGLTLITLGLFEKMVVADGLMAPIADQAFAAPGLLQARDAWGGALAFCVQIFCDFAGYSTCAVGAAMCLGFSLPDNFRRPFAAVGCIEFWQRWHITLSSWFRDYVFQPLGGYRGGALSAFRNIMITMLLCGLWHGANWTFVLFGAMHGLCICIEVVLRRVVPRSSVWTRAGVRHGLRALTAVVFSFTAVVFRSTDLRQAFLYLRSMLALSASAGVSVLTWRQDLVAGLVFVLLLRTQWLTRDKRLDELAARAPWWLRGVILALMLVAILTLSGRDRAFIYFQF